MIHDLYSKKHLELLKEKLDEFKISPKNLDIYLEALTHSSFANEYNLKYNYEKLEFLGDAAISWVISNYLYSLKQLSAGEKSIKKAKLVSGKNFVRISGEIQLDKLVFVGKGLQNNITNKILEDCFEAFMGAIAQDQGIRKMATIIDKYIIKPYEAGLIDTDKPFKTLVQEVLMRTEKKDIKYVPIQNAQNNFRKVKLVFDNQVYGIGIGKSLREAEEAAAHDAYSKLTK